eukprot:CAMPEP_0181109538 /NCGR_PEP_ID=MMETSP1071-20121207/18228_1 /TAXON_ID=35127 /ORGANISM="Thalassiosira sp., Strain NH16" /LENGTH=370 /DNA_ID=CAMNT_0023193237 /DNA_START=241 /DNA_END=1353 /DNA_ORIENTATION=+
MNEPRYNDNGGGNSWHNNYPANRRNVHSTGRSNYGGSSNRGGNNKQGNAIGNWIQNRRRRRQQRRSKSSREGSAAVGTEANAIQNITRNAKHFSYPAEGFETPIEHSLLYAMIEFPERYPESVVKSEIEDEEFEVYLYVNDEKRKVGGDVGDQRGGGREDGEEERNEGADEGSDHATNETTIAQSSSQPSNEEQRVSYAQLSALLALSAEKNPSKATPDQERNASSSGNNLPGGNSDNGSKNNIATNNNDAPPPSIGQALCRKLLKTVTRYCDSHSLDRQTEVSEFLSPIERRCQIRNEKAALQQLLPAYAGYTLSLVTGNPLPLLIGAVALTGPDKMADENNNVGKFRQHGGRVGDLETAGLLEECDSD